MTAAVALKTLQMVTRPSDNPKRAIALYRRGNAFKAVDYCGDSLEVAVMDAAIRGALDMPADWQLVDGWREDCPF